MSFIQKTFTLKAGDINKKWFVIDAEGVVVGRLATEVVDIVRGKNKASYTPSLDNGDNVVIINADKVVFTGNKDEDKDYINHSKFAGGLKIVNIKKLRASNPEYILEHAIHGMLPKTKLGREMMKNVKIYAGSKHPHAAQQPIEYVIKK